MPREKKICFIGLSREENEKRKNRVGYMYLLLCTAKVIYNMIFLLDEKTDSLTWLKKNDQLKHFLLRYKICNAFEGCVWRRCKIVRSFCIGLRPLYVDEDMFVDEKISHTNNNSKRVSETFSQLLYSEILLS